MNRYLVLVLRALENFGFAVCLFLGISALDIYVLVPLFAQYRFLGLGYAGTLTGYDSIFILVVSILALLKFDRMGDK